MDEPPKAHVADDRPADLHDLLLRVGLQKLVEQRLVDVLVVDVEPLGVVESCLLGGREVGVAPAANLRDGALVEAVISP